MRKIHLLVVAAAVPAFAIHAMAETPTVKPPAKTTTGTKTVSAPALSLKVPNLDAAAYRLGELKTIPPLSLNEKRQVVEKSGSSAEPGDFEGSFTLSPKTPWLPSGASINFYNAQIVSAPNSVAYIGTWLVDGSNRPFVTLNFTAQPSRRYLVDCAVVMNQAWKMAMRATAKGAPPLANEAYALVAPSPAPQNHVSLLIPQASYVRELTVYLSVDAGEQRFWGLHRCEVTPIR